MADPPQIRRPNPKAPPVPPPPRASPVAPAPAKTDVEPSRPSDLGEDTSSLAVPDAAQLVEHILALVASEAEALLGGDDTDGKLADLNVRTALASWDALHQPDEALRLLEVAETHPLVPRLVFAAAITAGAEADLEA